MDTKNIVKKKMESMFFDLQRKMMELERIEQKASVEEVDYLNIAFLMRYIQPCQDGIHSYLQRHYKWDKDEAMERFFASKWYKNFMGEGGIRELRSARNFIKSGYIVG